MALQEDLPLGAGADQWEVWGTTARIVVRDPAALRAARGIVAEVLADVDAVASRFRPDSEVCRLRAGETSTVSPLLAELVQVALGAARRTDGDVDPTLGRALCDLGYDRDLVAIGSVWAPGRVRVRAAAPRPEVRLRGRELTLPPGVLLDLGATAKAWTADHAARLVADRLATAVLVSLGGDIATAGPPGAAPWHVLVRDRRGEPETIVAITAGHGLATSSTRGRRWRQGAVWRHHVLDPRTLLPAAEVWRTVSVAAPTCLAANTLTTASIVRGHAALGWLRGLGAAARLVTADGQVVTLGGWPAEPARSPGLVA